MLPAINVSNNYTPPPTLVGEAIPGNQTLRVNPANVSPAVSGVEIHNNNRGGAASIPAGAAATAPAAMAASFSPSPFIYVTPTTLNAGAQNTFLAQLMSQDASPAATRVLQQYEQLVAISFVKYRPSNATLPEPEPVNLFGKILQQQREVQSVQQVVQQASQQSAASQATAGNIAATLPKEAGMPARSEAADRRPQAAKATAESAVAPRAAVNAYLAVAARNDASRKPRQPTADAI